VSSFYTRLGDNGYTGVLGEGRLPKHHPILEAVGTVDEATAALGIARAGCRVTGVGELIIEIQRDLYYLMAEVAATPENAAKFRRIDADRVAWLERQVESLSQNLDPPGEFILPGDSPSGAAFSMARVIVRRAERRVVRLFHDGQLDNPELLGYLNRLSSLCFILELIENRSWGKASPTLARNPI
jgi:cob(I)alamin adenosyltransferase